MKKFTLTLVAALATLCAIAQTKFWVCKNDGTSVEFLISETDSITFTDPSTPTPGEKCKASDYAQVTIGMQTWMAENYRCSKYDTQSEAYNASWLTNNTIPTSDGYVYTPYYTDATDKTKWSSTEYAGSLTSSQITKLGYLYNWAAAVGVENGYDYGTTPFTGNRQGICPNGWHVPTRVEWRTLQNYIEVNQGKGVYTAGKHLKTTSGWYNDGNGTDSYGFSVLPAGYTYGSSVGNVGNSTSFWTATPHEYDAGYAYQESIGCYDSMTDKDDIKEYGKSVRCVKNDSTSATETEADSVSTVLKQLVDGQIVIVAGDRKFNLQGVEIK